MQKYPVGGSRQAVYDLLRGLGFSMDKGLGDKNWTSADGIKVSIYGTGSMAHVWAGSARKDIELDKLSDLIALLRAA